MHPSKWDNFVAWYFVRRWKKHFENDKRLLVAHMLEFDTPRLNTPIVEDDNEFFEELVKKRH